MEFKSVKIEKPVEVNFILGQSHFIKTVEDIHEAIVQTVPGMLFGLAFCEASGPRKIRFSGNSEELIEMAKKNAMNISAGHSFILFIKEGFPVNILNTIQQVPEVVNIFCATANPTEVLIAETPNGRAILGVVDGGPPTGFESEEEIRSRKELLRKIGYKLE